MEQDIAVGLDIGTTKVCAIVASPDVNHPGKMKILGIGKSTSEGLTRGVVTNIEKTVKSIESAVADAEAQSGVKISAVTVGIAGDHIQSFQSRGVVFRSGPGPTDTDSLSVENGGDHPQITSVQKRSGLLVH